MNTKIRVLFIGDIFGKPGISACQKVVPYLQAKYQIDFTIAQAENVSGRKGLIPSDYYLLKNLAIDAFTLGNHVWSKNSILEIIENQDLIRPLNVSHLYPGSGMRLFQVKDRQVAVLSLMGITFNKLLPPWNEEHAQNFFDAFDTIYENTQADHYIVDFHAETTSEKNVFGLYLDGKVDAFLGTHTHVQTNDAQILPNGMIYLTDAGACAPVFSAIGANYTEVYKLMRFGSKQRFQVSDNLAQFNGIIFEINSEMPNKIIKTINLQPEEIAKIPSES